MDFLTRISIRRPVATAAKVRIIHGSANYYF